MKLRAVEALSIPHKSEHESAEMGVKERTDSNDADEMENN